MVVDDELRAAVENIGETDGPVGADQGIVRQLDHGQAAPLGGDRIQFASGGLLALAQVVERGAPGLAIDDWR